ncbi:protein ABHD11-like [Stegodyphus dumicola]|uniref:protein ABHD11-like n=1 Tax=Stegodyphus dumicola TaxID=202533 RepID=UPI0015A86FDA|nr:protein ABHD11-like [Stegodyphus dumicola]
MAFTFEMFPIQCLFLCTAIFTPFYSSVMASYIPVRLAYNVIEPVGGITGKSPIIFLHGVTESKEYWADVPQVVANATRRKVYVLDARNHWDSDWSNEFTFDLNSDDLVDFMDKMNIPKAILIGHSMGGMSAIRTSLKKPEKVEMAIVKDMYVRKLPKNVLNELVDYTILLQEAVDHMPYNLDKEAAQKFIQNYLISRLPKDYPALEKIKANSRLAGDLKLNPDGRYRVKSNLKILEKAMRNADTVMEDPSGLYHGPACFIYGALSPFLVGADKHHIKQFFLKVEFVEIEDATHDVHIDQPLHFTDAVLKFIFQNEILS